MRGLIFKMAAGAVALVVVLHFVSSMGRFAAAIGG